MSSISSSSSVTNPLIWQTSSSAGSSAPASSDFAVDGQNASTGSASSAAPQAGQAAPDSATAQSIANATSSLLSIQEQYGSGQTGSAGHHRHGHHHAGGTQNAGSTQTGGGAQSGGAAIDPTAAASTGQADNENQLSTFLSQQASAAAA